MLQTVRASYPACQFGSLTIHEKLNNFFLKGQNLIAGYGKIGLDYKLFGKPLAVCLPKQAYQSVCKVALKTIYNHKKY